MEFTSRLVLFALLPLCLPAEDLRDYLTRYEGRWSGSFTIHSTASGYTENFPVEQRYWMQDDRLRGIAVTERDGGMVTTSSWTYIDGRKLVSEVTRDGEKKIYYGLPKDDVIVWISSNMNRVEDYQLTERIVEVDQKRKLMTEGFDTYIYAEGIAHIIYRGELLWQGSVSSEAE